MTTFKRFCTKLDSGLNLVLIFQLFVFFLMLIFLEGKFT